MVLWLCEGLRGGGERQQEDVRGLRPEGAKLRAAGGGGEAMELWLCEGRWCWEPWHSAKQLPHDILPQRSRLHAAGSGSLVS